MSKFYLKPALTSIAITALVAAPVAASPLPAPPQFQHMGLIQPVMGQEVTDSVVNLLKEAASNCNNVPTEYQVDCLRQGLRAAQSEVQRRPDYRLVSKELNTATRALDKLVKANVDRAAPKIRVAGRTVRAVKKTAAPQVAKAAQAVITESATRLLRSSSKAKSQAQVAQIAQAFDSTKVILRS